MTASQPPGAPRDLRAEVDMRHHHAHIHWTPEHNPPEVYAWRVQRITPGRRPDGSKRAVMWWPGAPRIKTLISRKLFRYHWRVTAHEQMGQYPHDLPGQEVLAERSGATWSRRKAYRAIEQYGPIVDKEGALALSDCHSWKGAA